MGVPMQIRRALVNETVTLDGEPARIVGLALDFALIETIDGRRSVSWSWQAVQTVCMNGGNFQS